MSLPSQEILAVGICRSDVRCFNDNFARSISAFLFSSLILLFFALSPRICCLMFPFNLNVTFGFMLLSKICFSKVAQGRGCYRWGRAASPSQAISPFPTFSIASCWLQVGLARSRRASYLTVPSENLQPGRRRPSPPGYFIRLYGG